MERNGQQRDMKMLGDERKAKIASGNEEQWATCAKVVVVSWKAVKGWRGQKRRGGGGGGNEEK